MGRILRITIVVAGLALMVWPVIVLVDLFTARSVSNHFVDDLSAKVGWNRYLIQALVAAGLVPYLYGMKLIFTPLNSRKRTLGGILVTGMSIAYNLTLFYGTKGARFGIGDGGTLQWYCWEENGLITFDRQGHCPLTGELMKPMTGPVGKEWDQMKDKPLVQVDPAKAVWFNDMTGTPRLYYYRFPDGQMEFFNRPGHHPRTGDPLLPVTKELSLSWRANQEGREKPTSASIAPALAPAHQAAIQTPPPPTVDERLSRFRAALVADAGRGQAGLVMVWRDEAGQEGADALSRQLPAFNSRAVRTALIQREGFGAELYEGDASLLRVAASVTKLDALVVAQVAVVCEKRSPVEADLLSCDLTANARKFDAQGNPAGTASARGTGAGFSRSDALEQAAQRAASGFEALQSR